MHGEVDVSRAGLSTAAVVDAALDVLDEAGPRGLSLAAVAARTGVAAPSLYKHVANLDDLRTLIGIRVLEELTQRFSTAVVGLSGGDAVTALLRAGRAYVVEHPARYAAMPLDALHDPRTAAAGAQLMQLIVAVLRAYGFTDAAAVHATRVIRTVIHGFAGLEAAGGFGLPEDLDETYDRLIRMVLADFARRAQEPARP